MKRKYRFSNISFINRWAKRKIHRSDNYLIVGIFRRWASPEDFCYKVGFFGLEVNIWFKTFFESEVTND